MGGADQDFDELDMLLGEIPTSANLVSEESFRVSSKPNLKVNPLTVENGKSYSTRTLPMYYTASQGLETSPNTISNFYGDIPSSNNVSLENSFQGSLDPDTEMNVKTNGSSPVVNVYRRNPYFPEEKSLASAFTQLGFDDATSVEQSRLPLVNPNANGLQNCTYLSEHLHSNDINQPISGLSAPRFASPNSQSDRSLFSPGRNNVDRFNNEITVQENGSFLKFDAEELRKRYESAHPFENSWADFREQQNFTPVYSRAMPLAPNTNTFQVPPNGPAPGVQYPVSQYRYPYILETQPPTPYTQHELTQSQMWQYLEEERYYRMQLQLQNQGFVSHNLIHENGNSTIRPVTRSVPQPFFKMPIPEVVNQENRVPVWYNAGLCRRFSPSELALMGRGCHSYPAIDLEAVQVSHEAGKPTFPEKILLRSQGLNLVRTINPSSLGERELSNHVNGNVRMLDDGNFCDPPPMLNGGSFQLQDSRPEVQDLKHGSSRLQPQKYESVDEVIGRIYRLSKDQNGCRFLQKKFTDGSQDDINKIFVEIIDHIVELMTDPFGNYLVQKLLEVCSEAQRMQILHAITRRPGELVRISNDMHGTRSVQKVIETLKTREQSLIVVSSLKPGIITLMKDQNGNHVVQRCLQYLMPQYSEILFEGITAHCFELSTDRHGCCVLQKCLGNCDFAEKRQLIYEITSNALILSQDPYGNYVVQFVLGLQVPWATADVFEQLDGNFRSLSMQKYSSNVVEKCLKFGTEEHRRRIIKEFLSICFDQILLHPFGNYVIQSALKNSKGALRAALMDAIKPHIPALKTTPFGKEVMLCYNQKK